MYYFNAKSFHLFSNKRQYFLLEIEKLVLFELSETSYNILKCSFPLRHADLVHNLKQHVPESEILDSIGTLLEWNILLNKAEAISDERNIQNNLESRATIRHTLTGLYLVLAQDCNLRCKYCSTEYGRYGRDTKTKLMSKEIAKKAIDFLLNNMDPLEKETQIGFTGGEPLMNFDTLQFVVNYLRTKGMPTTFIVNTNGTMMTREKAKWLVEEKIPIRFSIDGTKEIHNINRVYPNGQGSYDDVIKGIQTYLQFAPNGFRAQTSIPHGKRLLESVEHLWSLGALEVVGNFTGESYFLRDESIKLTESDKNEFIRQWKMLNDKIADSLTQKEKTPMLAMTRGLLKYLHTREGKAPGCGIGRVISVDPDGNLDLCQAFVGLDEYAIGDLEVGLNYKKIFDFYEVYYKYLDKCKQCWAKYICGSGCIAQAVHYNELGDAFEPLRVCDLMRSLIEAACELYARLKENCPEVLEKMFTPLKLSESDKFQNANSVRK